MKNSYSFRFTLTLVLLASALTGFLTAMVLLNLNRTPENLTGAVKEYSALLELIDEIYIGEFDMDDVSAAAMRAAVDSLGDRWSFYMTPQEFEDFLDRSKNRYAGIGVGVEADEETGGIRVLFVYRDSAAETAGIAAGDIIIGVDGDDIYGISINDLRVLLARQIDDTVELLIMKPDGLTQQVTVVYSYVFVNPVSYEMLDGDIGYISLLNFDEGAADKFISAAKELMEMGARAFIFDMRANNGGRVDEMTRILDFLLPEGEIFISVDKSGHENIILSDKNMVDLPAIVLVDSNSYSAAEYFAATLREYDYAEIVGEQTTGKSRMQITLRLPGGGALHISSSQYLTRNRVSLHDAGGLEPDHIVLLSEHESALFFSGNLSKDDDPQLQKALSLISFHN